MSGTGALAGKGADKELIAWAGMWEEPVCLEMLETEYPGWSSKAKGQAM